MSDPITLAMAGMQLFNMLNQKPQQQQLQPLAQNAPQQEAVKSIGELLFEKQLPTNPQQIQGQSGFPFIGGF